MIFSNLVQKNVKLTVFTTTPPNTSAVAAVCSSDHSAILSGRPFVSQLARVLQENAIRLRTSVNRLSLRQSVLITGRRTKNTAKVVVLVRRN